MGAPEEIGAYLVAQNVTTSDRVFYGALPEKTPHKCLAIIPRPGGRPGKKYGQPTVGYDFRRVQILCRGDVQDYQSGEGLAEAAYAAVVQVQAETLSGTLYHTLAPADTPAYVGEDGNRRPLFSLNLQPEREP